MENTTGSPRFWYSHPFDIERVMSSISEDDLVLEVGAVTRPLIRADQVVSSVPCDDTRMLSVKGWPPKHLSADKWLQLDLSLDTLAFADKSFDFVFCSQTLSSLRDPISLCKEIMRVGKKGFFDFPSKWIECQRCVDAGNLSENYSGYITSRWLIEIGEDTLTFSPKTALSTIAVFEKKPKTGKYLCSPRIWATSFFWEGSFEIVEKPLRSAKDAFDDLATLFKDFDYTPYDSELDRIRRVRNFSSDRLDGMLALAWSHHKNGRYHLAVRLLRDILRETPDNVDAEALLGLSAAGTSVPQAAKTTRARSGEPSYV